MARHKKSPLTKRIEALRRTVRDIDRALASLAKDAVRAVRRASPRPARPYRMTAKRRAALKKQGAYIGHLRHLKPAEKARVKALKVKRGVDAAIVFAKRLAKT